MNINQLRKELERDEGCKYEIYLDHLGHPTFGIGHLITDDDPEWSPQWALQWWSDVGTEVSEERVKEAFSYDIEIVLSGCCSLYKDFNDLPEDAQLVIANMMFNMGLTRLSKFKKMKAGVDARDWNRAANEMMNSKWHSQVTARANRLIERIRALA